MSLAPCSENTPTLKFEFKLHTDENSTSVSVTPEDLKVLLGQELFTQDESRLTQYSEMLAKDATLLRVFVDIVLASRNRLEDSEDDRIVTTAAANAITVLNYGSRSGMFPFHFIDVRDWSGIRVPNANLNYALMAYCNLDDADLSDVSTINICLFGARLRRANLSGVKLQESKFESMKRHRTLSVHPNGRIAASGSSSGTIHIFDLVTGEHLHCLYGHTSEILSLNFNCDGSFLGSVSQDRTVRIWDMSTYRCKSTLQLDSPYLITRTIGFSPDNRHIVVVWGFGTFRIGDVETAEWGTVFTHEGVMNVDWSSDGNHILTCSIRYTICVWDYNTQSCTVKWSVKVADGCNAQFTRDGAKVVVNACSALYIFDASSGTCIAEFPKETSEYLLFALDSRYLYVVSYGWIYVYDLETCEYLTKFLDEPAAHELFSTIDGQELIIYCRDDGIFKIFDVTSLDSCVPTVAQEEQSFDVFVFSPDNRHLVASSHGYENVELKLVDIISGDCTDIISTEGYEEDEIRILSCCPTGRLIAYVGYDSMSNKISIYDLHERKCIQTLDQHITPLTCIAFSPKGDLLASSEQKSYRNEDKHGNILLWDTTTWTYTVLYGHTTHTNRMCFSPDGSILAALADDGFIRIWNVITHECIRTMGDDMVVYDSMSYSPCGRFLATAERTERYIRLWDMTNGKCITSFREPPADSWCGDIGFLRNGRLISVNGIHRVYDVFTGKHAKLPFVPRHRRLYLSPDCGLMATKVLVFSPNALYLWKFPDDPWQSRVVFKDSTRIPASIVMDALKVPSKNDKFIIVSASDQSGSINMYADTSAEISDTLQGHSDIVTCLDSSDNGCYLVSGSRDTNLRVWDVATQQCIAVLEEHTNAVSSVQFSPDGQQIASGSYDMTICIWNTSEHVCTTRLEGHTTPIKQVLFSPDGTHLASIGSGSHLIYIWDLTIGALSTILDQHTDDVFDVQFSADGSYLASGSHDDTIRVWDIKTGECSTILKGHRDCLTCFSLTLDGKTIVSGSEDNTIRIWDVSSTECKLVIEGHTGHIRSLYITPDGLCVISASNDHVIHIWDIATGEMLHQLLGHNDAVTSVKLIHYDAQGDSTLLSTSLDGTARLWTVHKLPSRLPYLPELRGIFGAQDTMDLTNADFTDAILDDSFSQLIDYYRNELEDEDEDEDGIDEDGDEDQIGEDEDGDEDEDQIDVYEDEDQINIYEDEDDHLD